MQKEFTIELDGKTYKGFYKIEKGMIKVDSDLGFKSTQLGGLKDYPEQLAERLLTELVRENK